MESRVVTGARVRVYINGRLLGRVWKFNFSANTPVDPIQGIDSSLPYELAPTVSHITGTLALYRLAGDGGIEGPGMAAIVQDILKQKYFTLMVVERVTDTVIFRADQCMVTMQNWDVAAAGRMNGTVQFQGIAWNNETA